MFNILVLAQIDEAYHWLELVLPIGNYIVAAKLCSYVCTKTRLSPLSPHCDEVALTMVILLSMVCIT